MQVFKDKKAIIVVAAVLLLVVAAGVALAMNLGQEDIDIAEQLSLGEKYLQEMNYEKAILAFNKVIKVDPRNVKAYLGLADAYVGTGDTDKAIETLEKGLELTGDERLEERINELRRQLGRTALLKELYDLFEAGSTNEALALVNNTEDFANLCADVQVSSPQIYQPNPGRGIGIYQARESNFGEYYVYYGDYEDGIRKGLGLWCIVNNDEYYIFDGVWDADAPNGNGEVKEWHGELDEGMSYRRKAGMLVNGLWNGDMLWEFIYPEELHSFPVHFSNGFCTILEIQEEDENNDELSYVMSNTGTTPDGDGDAIMTSNHGDIRGYVFGIAGFDDSALIYDN